MIKMPIPKEGSAPSAKSTRDSNLELYRIVCMLMIVAYHYVVNSGLTDTIKASPLTANSIYLILFGAWGKVGINCFLMITGYFMCKNRITLRKFIKMIAQIYFYNFVIFTTLLILGYEHFTTVRLLQLLSPVKGLGPDFFISCFIVFWLTIPFLNILVHNMTKREHELLIILFLAIYTIGGTIPHFDVPLNYISWFGGVYFIASYIRLYNNPCFEKKNLWGWLTITCFFVALVSIICMQYIFGGKRGISVAHFFIVDSNKILAVVIAICSFLWFKNMKIGYSKIINAVGASTFGVLLIHANSNAMRQWLWKDIVDCVGHYYQPLNSLAIYSFGVVMTIFLVCSILDILRSSFLETPFLKWYDKHNYDDFMHKLLVG